MKTQQAKTEACNRAKKSFFKYDTGGSNTYKGPAFVNGFDEGEKSMISIHSNLVKHVKEYLYLFKDDGGFVNYAFQKDLDEIEELTK